MLKYFSLFYYTVPIQAISTLIFIINGVINYRKIGGYRTLLLYGVVSFSQCGLGIYISVFTDNAMEKTMFIRNSINIFMLFEWIIFYHFLITSVSIRLLNIILKIIFIVFILLVLYCWLFTPAFNRTPSNLTVLESYLIIMGCLFYYFQIFTSPPTVTLLAHPSFWIITGMLLLFAFLMPLFLHFKIVPTDVVEVYNAIYVMNFIGYTILFIFFNIGLRCQIKSTI